MAVTPESNLALIEELQDLVGASTYEPVDGPEFSYPAVGQAVDDEMWKYITLALGNGILDDGGYPYWLRKLGSDSETNSANQMRLTVATTTDSAQAVLKGFYHRLLQDMRLDFPMPLAETTYYVVLELNPLKARAPEGPISVKVYPNELNTESGREHLVLWTVTRKPNQLLTDATVTRYRPRVAPTLSTTRFADLPDPSSVLFGTMAFAYNDRDIFVARGANNAEGGATTWSSLFDWKALIDPPWTDVADGSDYGTPGHGYMRGYRMIGDTLELRGRVSRMNRDKFYMNGGNDSAGYKILNFGSEVPRPAEETRMITASDSYTGNKLVAITIKGGSVYAVPILNDCSWISLDNIRVSLKR